MFPLKALASRPFLSSGQKRQTRSLYIRKELPPPFLRQELLRFNVAVLGRGTTAVAAMRHLDALPLKYNHGKFFDFPTIMIGGYDLWNKMPSGLRMGQQGTNFLSDLSRSTPAHYEPYMRAGDYKEGLDKELEEIVKENTSFLLDDTVTSVQKHFRNEFLIQTRSGQEIIANLVVVATGPGYERSLPVPVRNTPSKNRFSYPEIVPGTQALMTNRTPRGGVVAVVGGGATGSWCAGLAIVNHNELIWLADPQRGGFSTANPAGRNSFIIQRARPNMFLGSLQEVEYRPLAEPNDPKKGGIILRIQDFRPNGETEGKDREFNVNQLIYAIGPNSHAALSFLEPRLRDNLEVVYDRHAAFSSNPQNCALALISQEEDLIVLGPAAHHGLEAKGLGVLWANMANTLPPPAKPLDGIPLINASVEALANYTDLKKINWKVANRNQIAAYLGNLCPNSTPRSRLEVANRIIEERKRDITEKDVDRIISQGLAFPPL